MKRIILTTFGSLGDLFPYIVLARELQTRGLSVAIGTTADHQPYLDQYGIELLPIGATVQEMLAAEPQFMRKVMNKVNGSEYVLRNVVMPSIRRNLDDIMRVASDADLFVTHPLSYATLIAARKLRVPFVATILSPVNFWSRHDPPAMPLATWLPLVGKVLGPGIAGAIMDRMKASIYPWSEEYRSIQLQEAMEVDTRNVIFEGQFSPLKNLGLFSPLFGPPQPDWPPNTVATGFLFLDEPPRLEESILDSLREFLNSGEPPIVFTLGSSAVWDAGDFYDSSIAALARINRRGVLLTGSGPDKQALNLQAAELPPNVFAVDYLPHNLIFRHASAIVHQGGIGTTAQALRCGRPQLVIPHAHDQFDNAARVRRLGAGLSIDRHDYNPATSAAMLSRLLSGSYQVRAMALAKEIESEDGARVAADSVLSALGLN